jgi:5-aminopentanamidase
MVTAAAVQIDIQIGNPLKNKTALLQCIDKVEADLLVFPECANSGYLFNDKAEAMKHAETIPGPFTDTLMAAAVKTERWVAVGLLERQGGDLFNSALLIGPDGELHRYRKTHLPFLGVDRFVTPGDVIETFETPFARLGILICYEWRFPEVARCMVLQGAEVLLGLSNWPQGARVIAEILLPARAAENRVWIVSANRVGTERGAQYVGLSTVLDPDGHGVLGPEGIAHVAKGEIDPKISRNKKLVKQKGEYEIDLIGDRRPSLYRLIAEKDRP